MYLKQISYSEQFIPGAKDHLRLVLVGLQGVGKSATGNTILGQNVFQSDMSSTCLTLRSEVREGQVCGRQVAVVDTPGLFNSVLSEEMLKEELERALKLCSPGPHFFLFIIQLGRFTEEERAAMDKLKEMLGSNVNLYSMVLFTYGDRFNITTIDQFAKEDKYLQRLIRQCGGLYHVFANTDKENGVQIRELLEKIDNQMKKRKNLYYVKGVREVQKLETVIRFAAPVVTVLAFSALMAFLKSHIAEKNMETVITSDVTKKALEAVLEKPEKALEAVLEKPEKALKAVLEKPEKALEAVLEEPGKVLEAVLEQHEKALGSALEMSEKALESALEQPEKAVKSVLQQSEKALEVVVDPPMDAETFWQKLVGLPGKKTVIPTVLVGLGTGLWFLRKLLKK